LKPTERFLIFLSLLCLAASTGFSQQPQYVQAYNDIRLFLFLFENGVPRQLEQQPVRSFKAGGERLAYVNNANDLIVYEHGEKHKLGDMTATTYELNQASVYYRRDQLLSVSRTARTSRSLFSSVITRSATA
jgi:hypothetical protein